LVNITTGTLGRACTQHHHKLEEKDSWFAPSGFTTVQEKR
jgi:hypothetical protein